MNARLAERIKNLEFRITFSETNLRYLYGDEVINQAAVNSNMIGINKAKQELSDIINQNGLNKNTWAGFRLDDRFEISE